MHVWHHIIAVASQSHHMSHGHRRASPVSHHALPHGMRASVTGGDTCAGSTLSLTWASCCRAGWLQRELPQHCCTAIAC
jgi:hypothetical protein